MSDNLTERIEAIADAYKENDTNTQQIVVGKQPLIEDSRHDQRGYHEGFRGSRRPPL